MDEDLTQPYEGTLVESIATDSTSVTMLKTHFAKNIKVGDSFDEVFKLDGVQTFQKKDGSDYHKLTLKDRTGTIAAKYWKEEMPARAGQFVKVRATVKEYQKKPDVNVELIRPLAEGESIRVEDFVPVGPIDRFSLMDEVQKTCSGIVHAGLREMCLRMIGQLGDQLRDAPAASKLHQPYIGGLIEHVFSIQLLATEICQHYRTKSMLAREEPRLRVGLLLAAALFHDSGKIDELVWDQEIGYSKIGKLVGHVARSMQLIERFKPAFWDGVRASPILMDLEECQETLDHFEHIVASHHGRLEWGAAKWPLSREAQLFHYIDMIDARMGQFDTLENEERDVDGFGGWDRDSRSPFYLGGK